MVETSSHAWVPKVGNDYVCALGPYGQSARRGLGFGGMEAPHSQVDPALGQALSVLPLCTCELAYLSCHSHQ